MKPSQIPLLTRRATRQWRTVPHSQSPTLRSYSTSSPSPRTSPFAPRHLLSIADLTPSELTTLVRNAARHKQSLKSGGSLPHALRTGLAGRTIALLFSKRSTRTRISSEGAVVALGGHPMFLGSGDIQLGVNESLYDTSVVVSSMVAGIVARVGKHEEVLQMARYSAVPVINALSDAFHPMQTVADLLTMAEACVEPERLYGEKGELLGMQGKRVAWVGDLNNVFYDLSLGAMKQGMIVSAAAPKGYDDVETVRGEWEKITKSEAKKKNSLVPRLSDSPLAAVQRADFIFTDTWISMGQEEEKAKRLRAFEGYQVTMNMAQLASADPDWKFMHCLPRHQDEVDDEVFYHPEKSLVFPGAENRLWAALAILEAFIVREGRIEYG